MTEEVVLEPWEPEVVSGSKFFYQRRLFSQINLSAYLRERHDLALRQFARGATAEDLDGLVEQTYDRFQVTCLWLGGRPELKHVRDLSNATKEFEYAWDFDGAPILWECSPNPIDDHLPDGCEFREWFLPAGETMERPYGEVFRDQLILMSSEELNAKLLNEIAGLVAWQEAIINKVSMQLEKELYMLAQSYRDMDPRHFGGWGLGD